MGRVENSKMIDMKPTYKGVGTPCGLTKTKYHMKPQYNKNLKNTNKC